MESCLRGTLYALKTRKGGYEECCSSGRVFSSLSQSGSLFDSALFFSFHSSLLFYGYSKSSADTNAGQNRSLTHCIKNLHRNNLKALILKHSLLFIHTFKNTAQLFKTIFCTPIPYKCYISSFSLFHLVQKCVCSC